MTPEIIKPLGLFFLALFISVLVVRAQNTAVIPVVRNDWMDKHQRYVDRASRGDVDVLFVGDSITEDWGGKGRAEWEQRFVPLKAANFGGSGDRTQHVLWRLQNGELKGISPKVAVVMIGTNNLGSNKPAEIAEGVTAIVREIQKQSPATKVILFGVFPRGENPADPSRAAIAEINGAISELDDGKTIYYLDIGKEFLQPDGMISRDIMFDYLHLTPQGYKIWADILQPKVGELLKQN